MFQKVVIFHLQTFFVLKKARPKKKRRWEACRILNKKIIFHSWIVRWILDRMFIFKCKSIEKKNACRKKAEQTLLEITKDYLLLNAQLSAHQKIISNYCNKQILLAITTWINLLEKTYQQICFNEVCAIFSHLSIYELVSISFLWIGKFVEILLDVIQVEAKKKVPRKALKSLSWKVFYSRKKSMDSL